MSEMRYQWTPASEPPEDDRNVLVWRRGDAEFGSFTDGKWAIYGPPWDVNDVTHWRDVEPPSGEGEK